MEWSCPPATLRTTPVDRPACISSLSPRTMVWGFYMSLCGWDVWLLPAFQALPVILHPTPQYTCSQTKMSRRYKISHRGQLDTMAKQYRWLPDTWYYRVWGLPEPWSGRNWPRQRRECPSTGQRGVGVVGRTGSAATGAPAPHSCISSSNPQHTEPETSEGPTSAKKAEGPLCLQSPKVVAIGIRDSYTCLGDFRKIL